VIAHRRSRQAVCLTVYGAYLKKNAVALDALVAELVEEHPQRVRGADLVVAIATHQQQRTAPRRRRATHNLLNQQERRLIGPVQVVQEHDQRLPWLDAVYTLVVRRVCVLRSTKEKGTNTSRRRRLGA